MAIIRIDASKLIEFLKDELDFDEKKAAITGLTKIDWNPFDDDGDEHVGVWNEMKNNWSLFWDAILAIISTLEAIVVGGVSLSAPQKKSVAVDLIDDLLKLPFFLEPFDDIIIGLLVDAAVSQMNKIDWGLPSGEVLQIVDVPFDTGVWREME